MSVILCEYASLFHASMKLYFYASMFLKTHASMVVSVPCEYAVYCYANMVICVSCEYGRIFFMRVCLLKFSCEYVFFPPCEYDFFLFHAIMHKPYLRV